METLFDPPGLEWVRVQPGLARMRRAVILVAVVVAFAVLGVGGALFLSQPWPYLVAVPLLLLLAWGWWLAGRNAASWGYAEREDDLWSTRGAMLRRLVVVPYGRMQLVDVTVGPLERAFGLAAVQLHTASPDTDARIPGLLPDEAARLRDRLTELGESEQSGL